MDNAYHFKRAVQIVSHDFDAIQRLCQVKVNEVGQVRLHAIGDVSMRAQGYIDACHDFLDLSEDRVRQLAWSLNESRMTRRERALVESSRIHAPEGCAPGLYGPPEAGVRASLRQKVAAQMDSRMIR